MIDEDMLCLLKSLSEPVRRFDSPDLLYFVAVASHETLSKQHRADPTDPVARLLTGGVAGLPAGAFAEVGSNPA